MLLVSNLHYVHVLFNHGGCVFIASLSLIRILNFNTPFYFFCKIHLLVHLPREVALCGPVHARWMFFLERYMGHLKAHGRNPSRIEGSICEGHLQAEAMHLCQKIVRQLGSSCSTLWIEEEQAKEEKEGSVLLGASVQKNLKLVEFHQVKFIT